MPPRRERERKRMLSIDETIRNVEKRYQAVTRGPARGTAERGGGGRGFGGGGEEGGPGGGGPGGISPSRGRGTARGGPGGPRLFPSGPDLVAEAQRNRLVEAADVAHELRDDGL